MKGKVRFILLFVDAALINLSFIISLLIRFDGNITGQSFVTYLMLYMEYYIYITLIKLIIFLFSKLYKPVWKYASIGELMSIVRTSIISNLAVLAFTALRGDMFPKSIYILVTLVDMTLVGGVRFSYRVGVALGSYLFNNKNGNCKSALIVGGGDAGAMVIREYKNHPQLNSKPVAIIDDDISKQGKLINGVPVVGTRKDIPKVAEELNIDEIIIAMPSARRREIKEIVEITKTTKCKLRIVPGMFEIIDGKVNISAIRDVSIEDLLGREEIKVDLSEISTYLTNKVVMVTGGGGSIGSELCRQVANFKPKKLIILDIYENNAYDIQNELLRKHKDLNLKTLIASIRDKERIMEIMEKEKPQVIFHAAAHKHVPLMEESPKEAIKNNVFGTLNVVQAADKYEVDRFILISTDKAVNPTNVMGASKRICEMIIQSINSISKTEFVAVRFGNVLGSNGSVIPLFKKQIAEGGPVTVTHEEVIRYFMTIPEAVQLVIQAGAMAKGGEVFILDMGEPVKILNLAEDLIRLSGYEPYVDIPIEIIGLRPGEKLYEELLLDEEGITATKHDKIFIGKLTFTDYKLLLKSLDEIDRIIKNGTDEELKEYIKTIVPTYRKSEKTRKINASVI